MPKRIVLVSTVVVRDEQRIYPELNKAFDFTKDEIATILALHPSGLRNPVNETATDTDPGTSGSGEKGPDAGADESAPGGSAKPTANKVPKKQAKVTDRAQGSSQDAADEADGKTEEPADGDEDEDDDL